MDTIQVRCPDSASVRLHVCPAFLHNGNNCTQRHGDHENQRSHIEFIVNRSGLVKGIEPERTADGSHRQRYGERPRFPRLWPRLGAPRAEGLHEQARFMKSIQS